MGTVAFRGGVYGRRVWKGLWERKNGKLLQCPNEMLGGPNGERDFLKWAKGTCGPMSTPGGKIEDER